MRSGNNQKNDETGKKMTYFNIAANTPEMMEARTFAYRNLLTETLRQLKVLHMEPSPENIQDLQETLALMAWITPPHWTGWVDCQKCGKVPAEKDFSGKSVSACAFCISPDIELYEPKSLTDHRFIGYCNWVDSVIARSGSH